ELAALGSVGVLRLAAVARLAAFGILAVGLLGGLIGGSGWIRGRSPEEAVGHHGERHDGNGCQGDERKDKSARTRPSHHESPPGQTRLSDPLSPPRSERTAGAVSRWVVGASPRRW